jgi:hypothetical protein
MFFQRNFHCPENCARHIFFGKKLICWIFGGVHTPRSVAWLIFGSEIKCNIFQILQDFFSSSLLFMVLIQFKVPPLMICHALLPHCTYIVLLVPFIAARSLLASPRSKSKGCWTSHWLGILPQVWPIRVPIFTDISHGRTMDSCVNQAAETMLKIAVVRPSCKSHQAPECALQRLQILWVPQTKVGSELHKQKGELGSLTIFLGGRGGGGISLFRGHSRNEVVILGWK